MLFSIKRARTYNGTSISYLKTIVRDPYQSDWMNMVHLFKYVRVTTDLSLILISDKSGILKWYIRVSYVVYLNIRGDNGVGLTMI